MIAKDTVIISAARGVTAVLLFASCSEGRVLKQNLMISLLWSFTGDKPMPHHVPQIYAGAQ
jgi:hypothetical protein